MKRQKRFSSERSIMAELYRIQRLQNALLVEIQAHDDKAKALALQSLQSPTGRLSEDDERELGWQKELGAKARRSLDRLENQLTHVRQTLAAFKTDSLPGLLPDQSINLQ